MKEKGNGSYLSGFKELYKEYNADGESKLEVAKHKLEDSKQLVKKIKEDGEGSYVKGIKKMYKDYKD